jgi:hypothetical protein
MKVQTVASLLSLVFLAACSSQTNIQRETLQQRVAAKYAGTDVRTQEPAPPAAGPEETQDLPAAGPNDVDRNPILVPSPLLRYWASSRTP